MSKVMETNEIDTLIANVAALSGALTLAGGNPETILCKKDIQELLHTLAVNRVELRAVYSGPRNQQEKQDE